MRKLLAIVLTAFFGAVLLGGFSVDRSSVVFAGEDEAQIVVLKVEGMTCEGCASRVKTALLKVEGVKSCNISLKEMHAHVAMKKGTDVATLVKAVESAGYKAKETAE